MRVLITGGTGNVGRAATARFVRQGWEVRVIGRTAGVDIPGAEYVVCDVTNYADLREQVRGCRAVVHLAAIPSPRSSPGQEVFGVNVTGAFNVFEAAAAEGIRRVVQASSINALGCAWSITDIAPQYLPIDEEHPSFTTDPYSFSKQIIEEIGAYYWRREGISSVALRLPWVYAPERIQTEEYHRRRDAMRARFGEWAALPEAEWLAKLGDAKKRAAEYRSRRPLEFSTAAAATMTETPKTVSPDSDMLWHAYTFDRFNFWTFVDERDSAQALEKGVTAEYEGSHALFINDDHNWLDCDTRTLGRLFFPEVSRWKTPVAGSESLVSIGKARALIGFEPEYSIHRSTQ